MNYYDNIKEELIKNEVRKRIKDYSKNKSDLMTYYNVGKLLIEAQGGEDKSVYGNKLIKDYSKRLTKELGKGYSWRNLYNMRSFYLLINNYEILQPVAAKLYWSHFTLLLQLKDINEIIYYIDISIVQNLSKRQLHEKIKLKEYQRLPEETKLKLVSKVKENEVQDYLKNPIVIHNKTNLDIEKITHYLLEQLILEDLSNFLKQLGEGFCFIDKEYKIKLGEKDNYIDILLFNYKFNCFVVVELKMAEASKSDYGQLMTYMKCIDEQLREPEQEDTIGILITKVDNKYLAKYYKDNKIFNITYLIIE